MPAPHPNKEIPLQAETYLLTGYQDFRYGRFAGHKDGQSQCVKYGILMELSNALFGELSQVKIKRQHVNLQIIVSGEQSESPPIRLKLGSAGNLEFGFGLGLLNSNLVWDILALTKHDVRC